MGKQKNDKKITKKGKMQNIAGRLPENSRNNLLDVQSKKTVKTDQKISSFH